MEGKSNVQNIFSSIANKYDRLNTILSFNTDKGWRKKAIRICDIKEKDKVLDLCCGTGQMIDYICREVGKDVEVTGLDFTEEMINVGYRRLNFTAGDCRYKLIRGDVQQLPFEDTSFDCITIAFGLRNVPDIKKALSEMYRVLTPGGRLVCLELSNPEVQVFKQIYAVYFNCLLPLIGYIGTGDRKAYFYLRDSVKRFMSKGELKLAFEDAGFEETGFLPLTGGIASIHYGRKTS